MLYFVLGVLSVLALMLIVVLIFGMVKVSRLTKSHTDLENKVTLEIDYLNRRLGELRKEIDSEFIDTRRDFNDQIQSTYRYTDSRIDKFIDKKK